MTLEEAYKLKGIAVTEIEIWQGQLRRANEVIQQELQKAKLAKLNGPVKEPEPESTSL